MSVYIIAEIGVNHDGNLDKAHKLIDAAADAGADAVKFQTYRADELAVAGPHRDMLAKYQMPLEWYPELKKHAIDRGVEFGSSAFDIESVKFLIKLGVPWIKIPSGENNNPNLVRVALEHNKVIISNGMGGISPEVRDLIRYRATVLHCVSNYPARIKDYDLLPLSVEERYESLGISDHTIGETLGIIAAAYELDMYEKHITLDCNDEGPDHKSSMEPLPFKQMVNNMREVEIAINNIPYLLCPDKATIPRARRVQTPEGFKRNP